MVMKCIVRNCGSFYGDASKRDKVSFHNLPREPARRAAWLDAIHRMSWDEYHFDEFPRICSKHFSENDFLSGKPGSRRKLKKTAVPRVASETPEEIGK